MLLPVGATSFTEAMRMGAEVYHNLKSVITAKYGQDAVNVGDEGGFAPNIQNNKEGLELIKQAIAKGMETRVFFWRTPFDIDRVFPAGYVDKVKIGMDVAASEFYDDEKEIYDLDFKTKNNDGSQKKNRDQLLELYKEFVKEFPVISIEDGFAEDDFKGFQQCVV